MKIKENPSITAARLLLKRRRKALSIDLINKNLSVAGLKPLSAETLDKNFKHVCVRGGQKWLLGGESAISKKIQAKQQRNDPKDGQKNREKKILKEKSACPSKSACANKMPENVAGYCKITISEGFDVERFIQWQTLNNALNGLPVVYDNPDAFVLLVGAGNWPSTFRGVEVVSNQNCSGVLLCPRVLVKETK